MVSLLDTRFLSLENPGNFLLAKTEVVMTTMISSHVKDKSGIFTVQIPNFCHGRNPGPVKILWWL